MLWRFLIADSITQGLQTSSNALTGNNYSLGLQNSNLGFGTNSLSNLGSNTIGNLGGGKYFVVSIISIQRLGNVDESFVLVLVI